MKTWLYFATAEKTSLASTIGTVINAQFIWRSAFNEKGAQRANVGALEKGDHIIVAWRHSSVVRTAYLECTVTGPFSPAAPGLVIDKLRGTEAQALVAAGYPTNSSGEVEGIRLDEIRECYFQVQGRYGGNNAIHKLAPEDAGQLSISSRIPSGALIKPGGRIRWKEAHLWVPVDQSALATRALDNIELEATNKQPGF